MEDSAKNGFTNATDAADYLVNTRRAVSGCSRDCRTAGVIAAWEGNIALDEMSLEECRGNLYRYLEDVYEAISHEDLCGECARPSGAPRRSMEQAIALAEAICVPVG